MQKWQKKHSTSGAIGLFSISEPKKLGAMLRRAFEGYKDRLTKLQKMLKLLKQLYGTQFCRISTRPVAVTLEQTGTRSEGKSGHTKPKREQVKEQLVDTRPYLIHDQDQTQFDKNSIRLGLEKREVALEQAYMK